MAASSLRIQEVPVATLAAFLEACAVHPTTDVADLSEYAGYSVSTARRALPSLETLGLVEHPIGGTFQARAAGLKRGMPSDAVEQIIRRALLAFRPFEMLLEGLVVGESVRDAKRKTLRLLDLPRSDDGKLDILLRWAKDLGVLEGDGAQAKLVPELSPGASEELGALSADDVESEAKARLFNSKRLGRDANNYLDETDRGLLADALLKYESDSRKSIEASGQVLEDFLRHVADDRGLSSDAKKASGVGKLANLLHTKGVIHNHQQKMVDSVATIRNATAHRKDKKTLQPWELTPFGAFAALSMTLTAVRSIYLYVNTGRQTI